MDDLGIDSVDRIEMVMAVENEFSVSVSDEELEDVTTVEDMVDLIERKQVAQ